jgi:hypothetical protein
MIRFLADASLRDAIVSGCLRREPAIDFLSANDANLEGIPDPEVLALAAAEGRIPVTSDLKTMPRHFGEFLEEGGSSAGVFLVKQDTPVAEVIEALLLVWAASEADEWKNRILEIPES